MTYLYLGRMIKFSDIMPIDPLSPVWRIDETESTSMALFNSSKELYRTIQQGSWPPFFDSPLFIIVNEALLRFFIEHVGEQFEHHPVVIYDRPTDANMLGYHRIVPNTPIDFDGPVGDECSGKKLWIRDGSAMIRISLELKNLLLESGIEGIECVPELWGLGG